MWWVSRVSLGPGTYVRPGQASSSKSRLNKTRAGTEDLGYIEIHGRRCELFAGHEGQERSVGLCARRQLQLFITKARLKKQQGSSSTTLTQQIKHMWPSKKYLEISKVPILPSEDFSTNASGSGNSVHARTVQTSAVFSRVHADAQAPSIILQDSTLSLVVVRGRLCILCSAEFSGTCAAAAAIVFVECSSGLSVHCRRRSVCVAVQREI